MSLLRNFRRVSLTKNVSVLLVVCILTAICFPRSANTYGLGCLAERQGAASEYYLGDALGSVRQLTNDGGTVTLARNYEPFGRTSQSIGTAQTDYGFTGEFTDASGLIYLRARY
jgi:hypothetical protein